MGVSCLIYRVLQSPSIHEAYNGRIYPLVMAQL
jgi:hypothetical protein